MTSRGYLLLGALIAVLILSAVQSHLAQPTAAPIVETAEPTPTLVPQVTLLPLILAGSPRPHSPGWVTADYRATPSPTLRKD